MAFIFLLTEKLNFLASSKDKYVPAGNYMFKVNNRNTRTRCETFVKLTIKAPERPLTRKNDGYSMRKNIWENNWIMKFSLSKVMRLFLPLNKFSVLVVDFEILNTCSTSTIKNAECVRGQQKPHYFWKTKFQYLIVFLNILMYGIEIFFTEADILYNRSSEISRKADRRKSAAEFFFEGTSKGKIFI